jgi:hypothetical protein
MANRDMEEIWSPGPELLRDLDASIEATIASQKPNGQFGTEPWISTDQNVLLALAAAWSLPASAYHHAPRVLDAIAAGGLALVEDQDADGMWTFRKKDHSTWGQILMPWTYSRWIRAFALVREALPGDVLEAWTRGLELGYSGIAATALDRVHNIPAHHAMGLYCAGQVLDRPQWQRQAQEFLMRVVEAQSDYGWWSEHCGPVVMYNMVYSEALGGYYALSGDEAVMPALKKAAAFHAAYVYPDGSMVETVDERNPYHEGVRLGNVGFMLTKAGRGFMARQHRLHLATGAGFLADYAAQLLLYGQDGPYEKSPAERPQFHFEMGADALIQRRGPWFASLSAYVCEPPRVRWQQDRQNFVSLYHDTTGLILGGGNTKLQPLWSTFTVGDTSLLRHEPGDEDPDFGPRPGLLHVPHQGRVVRSEQHLGLELSYGEVDCRVTVTLATEDSAILEYGSCYTINADVQAHLPLRPRPGSPVLIDGTTEFDLCGDGWTTTGTRLRHGCWELQLPQEATIRWPVLPHNPYRKDGAAAQEEGLMVVSLPLQSGAKPLRVTLRVLPE